MDTVKNNEPELLTCILNAENEWDKEFYAGMYRNFNKRVHKTDYKQIVKIKTLTLLYTKNDRDYNVVKMEASGITEIKVKEILVKISEDLNEHRKVLKFIAQEAKNERNNITVVPSFSQKVNEALKSNNYHVKFKNNARKIQTSEEEKLVNQTMWMERAKLNKLFANMENVNVVVPTIRQNDEFLKNSEGALAKILYKRCDEFYVFTTAKRMGDALKFYAGYNVSIRHEKTEEELDKFYKRHTKVEKNAGMLANKGCAKE